MFRLDSEKNQPFSSEKEKELFLQRLRKRDRESEDRNKRHPAQSKDAQEENNR
jgi:hypothetical protein